MTAPDDSAPLIAAVEALRAQVAALDFPLELVETAPGVTAQEVVAATAAPLRLGGDILERREAGEAIAGMDSATRNAETRNTEKG